MNDGGGVYEHATVGQLSPAVADAKSYVYVPSNDNGTVTVIDQATMQVVDTYHVGKLVQHVVADWDLRQLYATASGSNQLVPIDPTTGRRDRHAHPRRRAVQPVLHARRHRRRS